MTTMTTKTTMTEDLCVRLVPLFRTLTLTQQRQLENQVNRRKVGAGTIVASPFRGTNLVIVKSGRARVYQLDANGNEIVQRILSAGDHVGEGWLLGIENKNVYVQMTTAGEVCLLSGADFRTVLQHNPEVSFRLLQDQARTISLLHWQTQLMSVPDIGERLISYLNRLRLEQGKSVLEIPLKMKDLASFLGTTPETLSRKLTDLEQKGEIRHHLRQITILTDLV
jgi:CRP-like cAMP-binding protein